MADGLKRNRWKIIVSVVTLLAMAALIYFLWDQIVETIRNLQNVQLWAVLLIIPLQGLNYHAQTKLYQGVFRATNEKVPYGFMYRTALELNFVNNVFPSGGVSGFSYFSLRMKAKKVSPGTSTLVQLMKLVLIYISFQILLVVGLLILAFDGKVNNFLMLIAGSLVTLLLVGTFTTAYIIGSKKRINSFFTFLTKRLNRFIHVFRRKDPETINVGRVKELFTELHEQYVHLQRNWRVLKGPLLFAILANLTEVASIYVVYIAFGEWVNIGAVIIAYAVANFAGLISVLPGGVGIYEALMTAVLAAGGIPAALSLPVTVMYRIVNMLVQIPPGFILYQRAIHDGPSKEEK